MKVKVTDNQLLTWDARRSQRLIALALERSGVDPSGIRFSVSRRHTQPHAVGNMVYIPSCLIDEPEMFIDCVAHEARHVEMTKAGRYDRLTEEQVEVDARQAGRRALSGGWPAKMRVPRKRPARLTR